MKYKIHLTDEDYLRFNIFYTNHSKAGKRSINMTRFLLPLLSAAFIMVFLFSGAEYGLIVTEVIVLAVVSVVWCIRAPKMVEKIVRKNIDRVKADGRLPFHADSEIEFRDSMIVETNDRGEFRVEYKEIVNIYAEKEYLYIFYGAVQAFIVPYRCLGGDKEQVVEYIMRKGMKERR